MTTIGVTFDGTDYSQYVFQADIWRDTLAGVGRWEVLMDPLANYWSWNLLFTPGNPVVITINASTMMEGIIDSPEPYLEGVETDLWKVWGRDWGYELASRFYTAPAGDYVNLRADDIINRVFTATATNITPPAAPFTAPFINYEWKPRTYLGDGVREICNVVNYDFYVADDAPLRTLHFFPQGTAAEHTGVNLDLIPNNPFNNILKFSMTERDGSSIKNYMVFNAGNLKDHWTDLNASGFTPRAFTVPSNNTNVRVEGKSSIQALGTANNTLVWVALDFPPGLYGYTSIDMSEPCTGRYAYLCHYPLYFPGAGTRRCYLQLQDVGGAIIQFYRTITAGFSRNSDATQTGYDDEWQIVDKIPFGEQDIERLGGVLAASTKGYWYYISVDPPVGPVFDWTRVERITFTSYFPIHAGDYFLVDSLMIPSVEVISVAQDAVSIASAWGQRDGEEYRPDIRNQVELDAASAAALPTLAYPLEKLSIVAQGQVVSDYAGQSLDVQANQFGLVAPTRYRIANLHHMVRRSSQESDVPGWNFLTEYELIADEFASFIGGKQYYNEQRFLSSVDARQDAFNKTRLQQRQRERGRVNLG